MSLAPLASLPPVAPVIPEVPSSISLGETTGGAAFQAAFTEAVGKVESFQQNASASVDRFLSGEGEELHQVALSAQRAELSFDLLLQVRNKVIGAYEEVMRMQV
ncbi:MAG: flagellar hook-basal body complex protein FliE [Acidobacteriota bacterium]